MIMYPGEEWLVLALIFSAATCIIGGVVAIHEILLWIENRGWM